MGRFFSDVWSFIVATVSSISIFDVIDIALVSILVYVVIKFIRDTRAASPAGIPPITGPTSFCDLITEISIV